MCAGILMNWAPAKQETQRYFDRDLHSVTTSVTIKKCWILNACQACGETFWTCFLDPRAGSENRTYQICINNQFISKSRLKEKWWVPLYLRTRIFWVYDILHHQKGPLKLEFQVAKLEEPQQCWVRNPMCHWKVVPSMLHDVNLYIYGFSGLAFSTFIRGYGLTVLTITMHAPISLFRHMNGTSSTGMWRHSQPRLPTSEVKGCNMNTQFREVQKSQRNKITLFTNIYNEPIQSTDSVVSVCWLRSY